MYLLKNFFIYGNVHLTLCSTQRDKQTEADRGRQRQTQKEDGKFSKFQKFQDKSTEMKREKKQLTKQYNSKTTET